MRRSTAWSLADASVNAVVDDASIDSSNAGLVGAQRAGTTGVVFWLAHVYACVFSATSMTRHRMLSRAEVIESLRDDWPLVE